MVTKEAAPADDEKQKRTLTVGQVVQRTIDLMAVAGAEAESAAQITRQKRLDGAMKKRRDLLGRLVTDDARDMAERMIIAALAARASVVAKPELGDTELFRVTFDELKVLVTDVVLGMRGQSKVKVQADDLERALHEAYRAYLTLTVTVAAGGDNNP